MPIGRFATAALVAVALPALPAAAEPRPWQINLPPPGSPVMDGIENLSNYLNLVLLGVVVLVFGTLIFIVVRFRAGRSPTPATWAHHTGIEIAWTLVPVLILLTIAVPSFRLLYFENAVPASDLTVKVTGHQWYWTVEYPDLGVAYDVNMVPDEALKPSQPRLLTADANMVLPAGRPVRVIVTADDIIHSFAVPSLGLKTDGVPGRLNETWVQVTEPGLHHGYCAELCGVRHAYMPVTVEAIGADRFEAWVAERRATAAAGAPRRFATGD